MSIDPRSSRRLSPPLAAPLCDADRHPSTGERLVDSADLPDSLAVSEATIEDLRTDNTANANTAQLGCTDAAIDLPFDRMVGWCYRFPLRPGDVLVYDNHRMLHGRTAFRGPRWVRCVYFDSPRSDLSDLDASG